MIEKITKRDGRVVDFDDSKIFNAIFLAVSDARAHGVEIESATELTEEVTENVVNSLEAMFDDLDICPTVEQIQDVVVSELRELNPEVADFYQNYREKRTKQRLKNTSIIKAIEKIAVETHRENANVGNNFSAKLLQIASAANKLANELKMPEDIALAHTGGDIHIHDLDSYDLTVNCLHIDTGQVLKKGFNTGYGMIKPPKRITSAAALSCIILQSSQNDMFGGQSHFDFDNDMAEFVWLTKKEIENEFIEMGITPKGIKDFGKIIEKKLEKEVRQAMQIVVYNLNSMHSRAGSQVPFSSINLGVPKNRYAEMVCRIFLEEFNKGLGRGEMPIFPNVIFRLKKGVNMDPGDPYYHLKQLAIKVAANRMNPTFLNCDSTFNKPLYDKGILPSTMGCRTRIADNVNGEEGGKRRGNNFPVSINLPRLAIEATRDAAKNDGDVLVYFFNRLDEKLKLCERQLMHRYDVVKKLKGKDLPFVVGENLIMGSEKVGPEDSIEPILKNGTFSIGFIGLAEALISMFGKHHAEDKEIWDIGFSIVKRIRDFCDEMTEKYHLNFTCYATPAEGLSGRFVAIDKERYGIIPGVTDKDYYTNSFHVPVGYNISIVDKADIEAPFHKICNAGHISYFELDKPPANNPEVIERAIDYIVNNTDMGYFAFNFGEVYCKDCGTNHIQGNTCPTCHSANLQGVYRVTGYLSLDERFSQGKKAERQDRTAHDFNM